MASASSEFIIRCKTQNGSFIMKTINSESSVRELKIHLSKEINIQPESIKILCGYPPKALADELDNFKLKDVNIHSGETIIIEKKSNIAKSKQVGSSSNHVISEEMEIAKELAVKVSSSNNQRGIRDDLLSRGIMMRHVVPSNNSCLFTSVYFVLSNGDLNPEKSAELRKVIARVVANNPDKFTSVFLGMENKDYCAWIQNPDHWGGGIELSILSEHFGIEIVAVDTSSLTLHRFGENSNYDKRIFLIYDGIHYDPLILEIDDEPNLQTIFPINDDHPMEMALEIAREAKSSRQYTDVANFTLKCLVCGKGLRGDKEAKEHALTTQHTNFGETDQ